MNMGDFRGSDVPGSNTQNSTFQWISGMSAEDQDQLKELMNMPEMQAGMETLAENFPAFASMIEALGDLATEDTTEAPATTAQGSALVQFWLAINFQLAWLEPNLKASGGMGRWGSTILLDSNQGGLSSYEAYFVIRKYIQLLISLFFLDVPLISRELWESKPWVT